MKPVTVGNALVENKIIVIETTIKSKALTETTKLILGGTLPRETTSYTGLR